jgi:hypothetical protein
MEKYKQIKVIGQGSFGKALLVQRRADGVSRCKRLSSATSASIHGAAGKICDERDPHNKHVHQRKKRGGE